MWYFLPLSLRDILPFVGSTGNAPQLRQSAAANLRHWYKGTLSSQLDSGALAGPPRREVRRFKTISFHPSGTHSSVRSCFQVNRLCDGCPVLDKLRT